MRITIAFTAAAPRARAIIARGFMGVLSLSGRHGPASGVGALALLGFEVRQDQACADDRARDGASWADRVEAALPALAPQV